MHMLREKCPLSIVNLSSARILNSTEYVQTSQFHSAYLCPAFWITLKVYPYF